MDAREERGKQIAARSKIVRKNGFWIVPSQTGCGHYRVHLDPPNPFIPKCNCPDFEARGQKCKHIFAVEIVQKREEDGAGVETVTETVTVKQRVTYAQDWPAYNAAQANEKDKFQSLLYDLCWVIPEPVCRKGRTPAPLSDRVFSAVFKVYSTFSGRRFSCDLKAAHERRYLSRAPHYNSVFRFLEDPELTPILADLIRESSLPLRSVETKFAVDSSGFTSSRFIRWVDHKYGVVRTEHDWVKCHVICGVKTNVVTAAEIGGAYAADSPQFAPLVNATARNFTIGEVSADKAYASYENMELVGSLGGTPYIPFRSNATAAAGGLYAKMFHYYNFNRDEFLRHYHKRSNVESTFSMIKAKFGDSVRSKTDAAMKNEALCKILAHNICCLIMSMYELRIEPEFWGEKAEAEPVAALA